MSNTVEHFSKPSETTQHPSMMEFKFWAEKNVRRQFNDASDDWAVRYLIDKIGLDRTRKLPRKEVVKLSKYLMPYVNEVLSKPRTDIEQRIQDEIDKRDYLADIFKMENGIYE